MSVWLFEEALNSIRIRNRRAGYLFDYSQKVQIQRITSSPHKKTSAAVPFCNLGLRPQPPQNLFNMIFHSPLFLFIFLPLTVSFFYQLKKYFNRNAALGWLVFTSLLFYSYWQPAYLVLLLASILFNYLTGSILTSAPPERKKIFLFIGIGVNITLLSYYKYSSFILKNISLLFDSSINFHPPLLPVAISFFLCQPA